MYFPLWRQVECSINPSITGQPNCIVGKKLLTKMTAKISINQREGCVRGVYRNMHVSRRGHLVYTNCLFHKYLTTFRGLHFKLFWSFPGAKPRFCPTHWLKILMHTRRSSWWPAHLDQCSGNKDKLNNPEVLFKKSSWLWSAAWDLLLEGTRSYGQ